MSMEDVNGRIPLMFGSSDGWTGLDWTGVTDMAGRLIDRLG